MVRLVDLLSYAEDARNGEYEKLSKKDREDAAPPGWGEPLFPEIIYLVFSVRQQKVVDVKGFRWSEPDTDFIEVSIQRQMTGG